MTSAPTFTLSLVRELRGSPLTVLVACILLEQSGQTPITAQLLKDVTGYKDHTITDSLRALESPMRQLVIRCHGGWRLASGFQLSLELSTGSVDNSSENREYRGFHASSSSSSRLEGNNDLLSPLPLLPDNNREYRDSCQVSVKSQDNRRACKAACLAAGIHDPAASQISALVWVTPDYIRDHVAEVQRRGQDIGLAIWRIKNQWDAPKDKSDSKRYAEGKFSEFIEH